MVRKRNQTESSGRAKHKPESGKPKFAGGMLVFVAVLGLLFSLMMIGSGFFIEDVDKLIAIDNGNVDIQGKIMDSEIPIENAKVSIIGTGLTTKTDPSGYFTIEDIPSGYHEIQVGKEGYRTIVFETYLPYIYFGFHPQDEDKHTFGAGDIEIKGEGELNFDMSEGTGTVEYGLDEDATEKLLGGLHGVLTIFGIMGIVFSIFALAGGVFTIKRERYGFALAGAVLGIFSFGFGLGSILAISALVLILMSSEEFKEELP